MLHFRRIMMMGASGLPSGYTPTEFVQTNGSQYLDTGIVPTTNTRVVMDAQLTSLPSSLSSATFFGVETTSNINAFSFFFSGSNSLFTAEVFSADLNRQRFNIDGKARVVVDFNKDYIEVNGDRRSVVQGSLSTSQTLTLFCLNGLLNIKAYYATCKFYGCKIYDGTTLVRDYVPAKNANGTNGIYDKVNKTFTNL